MRALHLQLLPLALGAVVLTGVAGCGGGSAPVRTPTASAARAQTTPAQASAPGGPLSVQLIRPTVLRDRPGGRAIARLATTTEFHSPLILPVVRRSGDWYGVISTKLPNGKIGWISALAPLRYSTRTLHVEVSLSRRQVVVLRGRQALLRFPVAVGGPGTPTPTGRFAVTDRLVTTNPSSPYGCCVLALSAHQPHTPQGWGGGDRIAIHATDKPGTIGSAASLGCLRAPAEEMRRAVRLVPLGTLVTIRA
jgi:L,D-transpeptidase catalytic domain